MNRVLFYVMPIGNVWLVRKDATRAEAYACKEDAVAIALKLAASTNGDVRVLERRDLRARHRIG